MRSEWRSGWSLVLASCAGMTLTSLLAFSTGLFVGPLEAEFGWSRTIISSGLTIYAVMSVIAAGFVGSLIDRFGPRRIALPGIVVFCFGFGLLGAVNSMIQWWACWILLTLGAVLVKPTVWSAAVASRFDAMRGLALSLALCGTALTAIFAPLIGGLLIADFGWRWGYVGIGAIWFVVTMPVVAKFFYGAVDLERKYRPTEASRYKEDLTGYHLKEGLKSSAFFRIAFGSLCVMLVVTGCVVNFIPMVAERGLDRETAVGLASAIGIATFVGRLITGTLLDRFPPQYIGGAAFALPAIACLIMLGIDGSPVLALFCALLLGASSGAEVEVASYLSSRYFGLRNFGTLFGLIGGLISLASGIGPTLAALTFDLTGSYNVALWIGVPLSMTAGLLILTLGSHPRSSP